MKVPAPPSTGQAPAELINDLKAAVKVNSSKGRRVLYPGKSITFDGMPLEVILRDDPSTRGICKEFAGTQLCLSSGAFGNFAAEAQNFIEVPKTSWYIAKAGRAADPEACINGCFWFH